MPYRYLNRKKECYVLHKHPSPRSQTPVWERGEECTSPKQFAQNAILSQNYNYHEESKHLSSNFYPGLQRLYLGGTQSPNKIGPGPATGDCGRKLGNLRSPLL